MNCSQCRLVKHVTVFPYHCSCGKIHQGTNQPPRSPLPSPLACIHRGDPIGSIDCNCGGKPAVYTCEVHGECALRKLKPGTPAVLYLDGTKRQGEVAYCNGCDRAAAR